MENTELIVPDWNDWSKWDLVEELAVYWRWFQHEESRTPRFSIYFEPPGTSAPAMRIGTFRRYRSLERRAVSGNEIEIFGQPFMRRWGLDRSGATDQQLFLYVDNAWRHLNVLGEIFILRPIFQDPDTIEGLWVEIHRMRDCRLSSIFFIKNPKT